MTINIKMLTDGELSEIIARACEEQIARQRRALTVGVRKAMLRLLTEDEDEAEAAYARFYPAECDPSRYDFTAHVTTEDGQLLNQFHLLGNDDVEPPLHELGELYAFRRGGRLPDIEIEVAALF